MVPGPLLCGDRRGFSTTTALALGAGRGHAAVSSCMCPSGTPRVVADPSSSRRSAAPASHAAQSRLETFVSVGGADLNPFTSCAITGSG